ncbi:MAG: TolC family protein [Bdellovibrionota bacterium]|nr:TolC family protein [Bdellovibrionota bacterium]
MKDCKAMGSLAIWIILILLGSNRPIYAQEISFSDAIEKIKSHNSLKVFEEKSLAQKSIVESGSSLGDSRFKVAAKNFPKNSLQNDQSPMTGMEFAISQKVAISSKYLHIEDSLEAEAKAASYKSSDFEMQLRRYLWQILIEKDRLKKDLQISRENLAWLENISKVSKKLYSNGKISQQALLEFEIRKAEIESTLQRQKIGLEQLSRKLMYLVKAESISPDSIPWEKLALIDTTKNFKDVKELSLQQSLKAKESKLTAVNLDKIPDLDVSIAYTKRYGVDNYGDFVSASITMPLPTSSTKYAQAATAYHEKFSAEKAYQDFLDNKEKDKYLLEMEIEKLKFDLKVLDEKTLKFASSAREITAKSYALGSANYTELLQSELKLQSLLKEKNEKEEGLKKMILSWKYLMGAL